MTELVDANTGREITMRGQYESPDQFKKLVASIAAELKFVAEKARLIRQQGGFQKFFNKSKNIDFLSEYVEALATLQAKTLLLNFISQTQISEMKKDQKRILSEINDLRKESNSDVEENVQDFKVVSDLIDNVYNSLDEKFKEEEEKEALKRENERLKNGLEKINNDMKRQLSDINGNMNYYFSALANESDVKLKISKSANPKNIWKAVFGIAVLAIIGILV